MSIRSYTQIIWASPPLLFISFVYLSFATILYMLFVLCQGDTNNAHILGTNDRHVKYVVASKLCI